MNNKFIETEGNVGQEVEPKPESLLDDRDARAIVAKIQQADQELVGLSQQFIESVASQYEGRGLSHDKLVAASTNGLIRAARKIDLSRELPFASYAVWWMRQEILQEIKNPKNK